LIAFLSRDRYAQLLTDLLKDKEAVKFIGRRGETLDSILEDVRARGYASNDGEWIPGLRAIGTPIFNDRGEVEASLSMSFFSQMVSLEDMLENHLPRLLETAGKISSVLGFGGNIRHWR
jgi:IclR family pca regulon transcriptional regulator